MYKSIIVFIILAIVCGVFFTSSLNDSAPEKTLITTPITIAVSKTPLSTPFYIAEDLGLFDKYCGEVDIMDVLGGKRSFSKMLSNEVDFATASDSVIVYQSFQRDDFVNIATFVESVNDIKIIVRSDVQISSGEDLKGKSIGFIEGSASDYFLEEFLGLHNLQKTDINAIPLSPEQTDQALINGEVEAISTWEPFAFKAIQGLSDRAQALDTKHIYSLTFNLLTNKSTLQHSPEKAKCILNSLSEAIDYISAEPEQSREILKDKLNLGRDFIDWVWPDYLFILSLNKSLILTMKSQANWHIENGTFNEHPNLEFMPYIDSSPLRAVNPGAVRL